MLASLAAEDFGLVAPHLTLARLNKGALLYDPGSEVETVYFPEDAVISMLTLMESGEAIESATVGREGGVGLMAAARPRQSLSRALVQVPGDGYRISVSHLHQAWENSPQIRDLFDRHNEALFGYAIQSVACNALHSVEARFCRWLLTCHDRIAEDRIALTQEFLADMLGVQRTTVTAVARTLQDKGVIRYRRGIVDIIDRPGLEAIACECYGAIRRTYERLLPLPQAAAF